MERSHQTIGNMVQAQLAKRDDRDWVDVLPGIMLLFIEMEQDNHGYSASKIMWGQGMTLPADLIYTPENLGKGDRNKYTKDLEKELREVRKRLTPFNQAASQPLANPFQEGDLILIYQQRMEKMHKLSPRWRGPYKVVIIPNSFQVVYEDQGREKITHVSNCKKFHKRLVGVGDEAPPPGDSIPKQKKWVNLMNCQNVPSSRRKMTLWHFKVRVWGMIHAFDGPDRFLLWLQKEEDTSADICM